MKKKIIVGGLLAICFSFVFSGYAYGLSDIRSEVNEIKEDIENLTEEIARARGTEEHVEPDFPGIPKDFRFDRHMRFRDYGEDVKYLQIILNSHPRTRLIEEGVGSPGNEVKRFGNLTKNALMEFQEMFAEEILYPWGISEPTGIMEIQTKKKLNKILDGKVIMGDMSPEKRAEFREEILRIIDKIKDLRGRLEDYEPGADDAPTDLRAAIISYREVRLTWNGDRNAEEFIGYKSRSSGTPYDEIGYTEDESGVVEDLEPGETYYFVVTQVVDGKESGYSMEVSVTMDWDPTPFNVEAEATDIGELTFTWETDQNTQEYRIYRASESRGPYTQVGVSETESFTDTGLGLQEMYYYVVTQVVDGEESGYSKEYVDSWFYNWQGGTQPHPDKEQIDFE